MIHFKMFPTVTSTIKINTKEVDKVLKTQPQVKIASLVLDSVSVKFNGISQENILNLRFDFEISSSLYMIQAQLHINVSKTIKLTKLAFLNVQTLGIYL